MSDRTGLDLEPSLIQWFRRQLTTWGRSHLRDFPWRRTCDPYAIFIAEYLLQKTAAHTVASVYESFLERYPTLDRLAAASTQEVAQVLKPLGLQFRAQRLGLAAEEILKHHDGCIPNSEAQLLLLPGIGKYTARAICSQAYGQSLAVLDTNVARILERFFGMVGGRVKSRDPLLWGAASQVAPKNDVGRWNLTLLDLGAAICTARNPDCTHCPLQARCKFFIGSTIHR